MKKIFWCVLMTAMTAGARVEWAQETVPLDVHPTQLSVDAVFEFTNTGDQPSVARLVWMQRKLHLKQLRKTELDRCTFPELVAQYRSFESRIRFVRNAHARGALTEAQRDTSIESLQREKNACVDDIRRKIPRSIRVRRKCRPLWHVLAVLKSKPESQVLLE